MATLCYNLQVKDTFLSVKDTSKLCTRAASLARFVCEIIHQTLRPFFLPFQNETRHDFNDL